jgi:hypothetical protein
MRATSARRVRELRERPMEDSARPQLELLVTLITALHNHDRRTRGHSERVRAYAMLLGAQLQLSPAERDRLQWAALLHDIGKLEVSPAILNKNGKPTDEEWAELQRHPACASAYLAPLEQFLGEWTHAADQHHERWDGTGYPLGLRETEISRAGRIVAIADAFEVMTAARSYKRPMSAVKAREELVRCARSHFDPNYVRAFMDVSLGRLLRVMGPLAWMSQFGPLAWLVRPETAVTFARPVAVGTTALAASAGLVLPAPVPVGMRVAEASAFAVQTSGTTTYESPPPVANPPSATPMPLPDPGEDAAPVEIPIEQDPDPIDEARRPSQPAPVGDPIVTPTPVVDVRPAPTDGATPTPARNKTPSNTDAVPTPSNDAAPADRPAPGVGIEPTAGTPSGGDVGSDAPENESPPKGAGPARRSAMA